MTSGDLRERITAQFSETGKRGDIWRGFDHFLNTDSFLNLGYSRRYQPHLVGSSQRRLATKIGRALDSHMRETADRTLLDVGCGRGGPAIHLEQRFGFEVTGVDLVAYNVAKARQTSRANDAMARFIVGDATRLPIASGTMSACTAIDSLVYVPERSRALSEIADVLVSGGVLVISDLVVGSGSGNDDRKVVSAFADAWDMPALPKIEKYREMLTASGLDLRTVEVITPHSVGRFRRWTTLFLVLLASPLGPVLRRLLRWDGIDPDTIHTQVQKAHAALPHLEHVIYVARKGDIVGADPS